MWAAIDAGSNTLRMLVGEVVNGQVVPATYLRRICRLAGGFTPEEGLSPEARERTLLALRDFAAACDEARISKLRAVGTAAFRRAVNGAAFAGEIRRVTQLPLEIISGEEEAACMAAGVLSALEPLPECALLIDIGGGSTEFVLCLGRRVAWSSSLPLGVVRLVEEHASSTERLQAIDRQLAGLHDELRRACHSSAIALDALSLVGTAGTVTTLAALDQQMVEYDWRRVNNYTLSLGRLEYWQAALAPLTPEQREALPGMEAGRGDLVPAGLEIIICLMRLLGAEAMTVSDFGLLEGLLLSLAEPR